VFRKGKGGLQYFRALVVTKLFSAGNFVVLKAVVKMQQESESFKEPMDFLLLKKVTL
jgi:hypothetical protein